MISAVGNSFDQYAMGWRRSFLWRDGKIHGKVAPSWVLLDLLICSLVTIAVAGIVEVWRRQRRRIWQLYLREVLVVCALIGVALAAGMQFAHQTRETAKCVARLKSHTSKGGGIGIDHGLPAVVREHLPESEFQPFDRLVYALTGIYSEFDNEDLRFMAKQPYLRSVEVRASRGCGPLLESFSNLKSLSLRGGELWDEDLRAISRIKGLKRLKIQCPILPRETLTCCAAMPSLKELSIYGRCVALRTRDGKIVDYHMAKTLEEEDIEQVEHVRADLKLLEGLPRLETLELSRLEFTRDSLAALASVESLKSLSINDCGHDPLDLEKLRSLRPDLTIDADH